MAYTDSEIEKDEHKQIDIEKVKEQEDYNETIVTLRIPKKYYKTGYAVAHLLGTSHLKNMLMTLS